MRDRKGEDFGGYYARDEGWSGGGARDDYALERGWSGGGAHDDYARDPRFATPSHRGRGPRMWRSDESIADEVYQRLTDDHDVDATDIDIKVENAEVTLTGRVATRFEKRRAEDIAFDCAGVHDVQNALRVSPNGEDVTIGKASE